MAQLYITNYAIYGINHLKAYIIEHYINFPEQKNPTDLRVKTWGGG